MKYIVVQAGHDLDIRSAPTLKLDEVGLVLAGGHTWFTIMDLLLWMTVEHAPQNSKPNESRKPWLGNSLIRVTMETLDDGVTLPRAWNGVGWNGVGGGVLSDGEGEGTDGAIGLGLGLRPVA